MLSRRSELAAATLAAPNYYPVKVRASCPIIVGVGAIEALRYRILALPGIDERPSRWGADPAFWIAGREFVHCHGDQAEVRVTRSLMTEALSDPRVIRRTRTSDWVQVPIAETELIARLAERAVVANLAGLPPKTRSV